MPKKQSKPIVKKAVVKIIKKDPVKGPAKELPITKKIPIIRENTKMFKLVEMIRVGEGTTLKQMTESLKWQPHTVRAALSRLNKTYNVGVLSNKSGNNERVYKL